MKQKKKIIASVLCIVLAIAGIWTYQDSNVNAEGAGTTFTISVNNNTHFQNGNIVRYSFGNDGVWEEVATNEAINIENEQVIRVKVECADENEVGVNANGEGLPQDLGGLTGEVGQMFDLQAGQSYRLNIEFFGKNQGNPGDGPQTEFNGVAYFFWKGTNGQTCYSRIEELLPGEAFSYPMNYINAKDLTDEGGSEEKYVFGAPSEWVSEDTFSANLEDENSDLWKLFDLQSEDDMHKFTKDPTTNKKGANSIIATPDREFRVAIITDDYKAVAVDAANMKYPECMFNDNVFGIADVDISGTTATNPAVATVYLEEDTITLGSTIEGNAITSLKPIDVPEKAVTIASKDNGNFSLTFNSKFYDGVVFEITTEDGSVSYLKVARTTLSVTDNFGPNTENPQLVAHIIYPETLSYTDFEVLATCVYEDGTTALKKAEPMKKSIDLGNGEFEDTGLIEEVAGDGLKYSFFAIDCESGVVGAYFNVIKKGAADGDKYAGTVCGSGMGAYYDTQAREIVY